MTIQLEHIQPDDWPAVGRTIDSLRSLVLDTGGRSIGMRIGSAVGTFPGGSDFTGNVVISHGLGRLPVAILLTCGLRSDGSGRVYASHFNENASTFTANALVTGANPAAAVTVPINWVVLG